MRYCGILAGREFQHLVTLHEVRAPEPPVRLEASFFEPGPVGDVVDTVRQLGDVVVAVAAPRSEPPEGKRLRTCDEELLRRGVTPQPFLESGRAFFEGLQSLSVYAPPEETAEGTHEGTVEEGAYGAAPMIEVNVDGVFCALQGRRVPAKRHPLGVLRRIEELVDDHVEDPAGDLWHRRIEEVDAAAAALAAHRYAVGHAFWLGDREEGVIVLPGAYPPAEFTAEGVIPAVERLPLGDVV
jgi:predicted nuclease with RNAse H fold